jgi:hypothetical protein
MTFTSSCYARCGCVCVDLLRCDMMTLFPPRRLFLLRTAFLRELGRVRARLVGWSWSAAFFPSRKNDPCVNVLDSGLSRLAQIPHRPSAPRPSVSCSLPG